MIEENRTVLVVDDDKSILRGFRAILEKEGYRVDTAETGTEALKKIQTKSFDVILLDIRLPDVNGTDLLPKMARNSKTIKIIITGFSNDEEGKKAAEYGADDFLVKPVKPEDLISTIRENLLKVQPED